MQRLPGLDALRGIAALVVVFGHALIWAYGPGSAGKFYLAVDVFFCLSGYVMARTYEHQMPTVFAFSRLRWRRLAPTVAVGTLIGAAVAATQTNIDARFVIIVMAGLALVPTPFHTSYSPLNTPAWSIATELVANVLHATALHRAAARLLVVFGLALILVSWAILGWLNAGADTATFWVAILRTIGNYSIGIVLWRSLKDRAPLPFWPIFLLPVLLLGGPNWLDLPIALLVPGLMVTCGLSTAPSALVRLGAISFPLYAIHMPIQALVKDFGFVALVLVPIIAVILWDWLTSLKRPDHGKPRLVTASD